MNGKALTSLFFLIVAVGFLTVFAFVVYSIAQGVGKATQKKMEKKNVVFSRDGMKVGVKEVSEERELDKSRSTLVNVWNHASFPAYKSRLWNMDGSAQDQGPVERRKHHSK